jgi:predicted amidohydrolase
VRVAAYQAPLLLPGCMDAIELIRMQVRQCEKTERIRILCCPEAILGGLADNNPHPSRFAIATDTDMLEDALLPLASDTVTSIVGFSEFGDGGRIYNSAAVFSVARSLACTASCTRRFAGPFIRQVTKFASS